MLCCYLLFGLCRHRYQICLLTVVWLISHGLTAAGVLQNLPYLTVYQNAFNWCGYFGIGMLLRDVDLEAWLRRCWPFGWPVVLVSVAFSAGYLFCMHPTYWTFFSTPCQLLWCASILFLAYRVGECPVLFGVGRRTYPIYFIHMQVGIGVLNRILFQRLLPVLGYGEYVAVFVCPVLVVLFTYLLVICAEWVATKIGLRTVLRFFGMGQNHA